MEFTEKELNIIDYALVQLFFQVRDEKLNGEQPGLECNDINEVGKKIHKEKERIKKTISAEEKEWKETL